MADTTASTSWPAARSAARFRAASRSLARFFSEDPPNFTTMRIGPPPLRASAADYVKVAQTVNTPALPGTPGDDADQPSDSKRCNPRFADSPRDFGTCAEAEGWTGFLAGVAGQAAGSAPDQAPFATMSPQFGPKVISTVASRLPVPYPLGRPATS